MDHQCGPYTQVVFIFSFNSMGSIYLGRVKCGLYKQVVLYTVELLYMSLKFYLS